MRRVEGLLAALEHQVEVAAHLDTEVLGAGSRCPGWTVRQVLDHSIGVTAKFTAFAAGSTDRPRTPAGDLLGADHRRALRMAADAARAAWSSADMERACHLSFATVSADLAAGINLFDVLAHTWDVASAVGAPIACDDDLWRTGLGAARELLGTTRDPEHYGDEIHTGPTASPRTRFLAYLGRVDGPHR